MHVSPDKFKVRLAVESEAGQGDHSAVVKATGGHENIWPLCYRSKFPKFKEHRITEGAHIRY